MIAQDERRRIAEPRLTDILPAFVENVDLESGFAQRAQDIVQCAPRNGDTRRAPRSPLFQGFEGVFDERAGAALVGIQSLHMGPLKPYDDLILEHQMDVGVGPHPVRETEGARDAAGQNIQSPRSPRKIVQREIRRERGLVTDDDERALSVAQRQVPFQ